jgi:hypothetical protein
VSDIIEVFHAAAAGGFFPPPHAEPPAMHSAMVTIRRATGDAKVRDIGHLAVETLITVNI